MFLGRRIETGNCEAKRQAKEVPAVHVNEQVVGRRSIPRDGKLNLIGRTCSQTSRPTL